MKLEQYLKHKFEYEEKQTNKSVSDMQSKLLSHLEKQKKRATPRYQQFLLPAFAVVLLVVAGSLYFRNNISPTITKNINPFKIFSNQVNTTPSISPFMAAQTSTNVTLATGFGITIPKKWSNKIFSQSKEHFAGRFFIPGENSALSYVDLESIDSASNVSNPFIKIAKISEKKINGITATSIEGQENFKNSKRQVRLVTFNSQHKLLTLTLYKTSNDNIDSQFDQLIASVQTDKSLGWLGPVFIKEAHAAEAIAGIDKENYQRIEVMAEPITTEITAKDKPYKDGYAKLYTFDAFKGQRLTTVAEEDSTTNPSSFIRSELYTEDGKQLFSQDTRIEFETAYTGKYYLIVRSFNNQAGKYRLKIFDRNQTENLTYLKYADGREVLVDYNKTPPQYGIEEAALIMQFISPVEVEQNSVIFQAKPREFEADPGEVSVPIYLYGRPGSYNSDIKDQQFSKLPEDESANILKIKITKLTPSKIYIEPEEGGLFPKNYHYNLLLNLPFINSLGQTTGTTSYGGGRFFTENSLSL